MAEAVRLGEAARGRSAPNPNVGCLIVSSNGEIVGRGATALGGRPHAEAIALDRAGRKARSSTVYVTLEPCAHESPRGPACADLLVKAKPARVVIAMKDPDPRVFGTGMRRLRDAGIDVKLGIGRKAARDSLAGWLTRLRIGRPRITLKLALSIDGKIALPSGESKWITGEDARKHVHLERAHSDMILVGRGTYLADAPRLDVRLPGLEDWSPKRALLTRGEAVDGWEILRKPEDVYRLHDVNDLLVEGGSATATAFLSADLVDRILIYRAPIIVGEGKSSFGYVGLDAIADAHGQWASSDGRRLGVDRLEVYERVREA
ncbi:bifunctional diaminohydroxyphosphoribosylaminopyrimidine deaminase/5-amino-6-(5-phosphoribosylamino)uracil reductase RibD [Sphingomonas sediminicola]|jgi:diaminohydroxyphosphoribosylaminopyrimidine deaminase/5-amino-6-(5-phosphoribosylamino)uracil reductase|uniref:Riboflavin biosynthesis protein RibD n=1 Tax=Sphingomonas sediminicola TaxID=386874 RepID=A0ABX6T7X7_9SPHN|nr:bifunctional diaminohydroxyphosphoribosylaminopyrimidine deaminase/5-amino-6-(5-phosphoribosylamino)uracil reductase RibD [Sphingomonas sediminicola]QNP45526.1 bifunctional diaminohydroxyphosphoribosylaminopyrimidine deaminase/5-amino-6-(5-phosphoribosylamino)uracil reductase RibD [Sphingomonas sediminicola]